MRRTPEAARTHILDAADRVFATSLPDQAGVREIAAAAKVSHGLVTHYFKTYDGLVGEVIDRRLSALRSLAMSRLATATFAPTEDPLLDVLMELLEDTTLSRLVVWSMLVGRKERVLQHGQLARIIDAMHARLAALKLPVARERLELSVVLVISTVAGWAIAGPALARGAGHAAPYPRAVIQRELQRMIRAYVGAS